MQDPYATAQEHVISYAYPTSDAAVKHRCGRVGCHILTAPNVDEPFSSMNLAVEAAAKLGTVPGRWSLDHPSVLALQPGALPCKEQALA